MRLLRLVFAALLCFTTWMMVNATTGPVSSCCPGLSNTQQRLPFKRILGYTIQSESICSFAAVVFHTKHGKRICSDPNSDRTKQIMLRLEEEKKKALEKKGQNEEGSARDITSTVSSTSKKTQQKKGRNGKRRQRKKPRTLRKGQKKRV